MNTGKDKSDYNYMSFAEATMICFKNNVFIYRVSIGNDSMKIEIDYDGRKKLGSDTYRWRTQQKEMDKKIKELYDTIARKIQDR